MPTIDVAAEIEIAADPADIAAVMFDPARAADWMSAVTGVEVIDPALVRGARVRHRGKVLNQEFTWLTEVEAVHFPHVLTLRVTDGPLVGTTRFDIQRSAGGSRVRIRNAGDPGPALAIVPSAMIPGPLRLAMAADLQRLKAIVEA
ncbi:MAG: SRPBCC family protein [Acidobacteria bacterium]|jgi:carbon monoxide dehydrogenase subunit G|nr:SRPBCC family protein [Acidobacteriota bacterium]